MNNPEDVVRDEERKPLDSTLPVIDSRAATSRLSRNEVSIGGVTGEEGKEKHSESKDSASSKADSATEEGQASLQHHNEEERVIPSAADILLG